MDWYAFAQEVHQNAVEHGFWEGERPIEETFALIHSEWSEALEEYRADRPMVWYTCGEAPVIQMCAPRDEADCLNYGKEKECKYRGHKPEGIAVELADGVIRILDFLAEVGTDAGEYAMIDSTMEVINQISHDVDENTSLPTLICISHNFTVHSQESREWDKDFDWSAICLMHAIAYVCVYLRANNLDPEALLREKHEYNKTRPYKHGKKC